MANTTVLDMLRKHCGDKKYHPLSALLDLTQEMDATVPDQISIHKTIAKYVEAENKSVEFSSGGSSGVQFNFDMISNAS